MPAEPMSTWWLILFIAGPLLSFLVGSMPFGYLIGQVKGIDIREHGSGNIGATNVWRVLGSTWGLLAFILDFFKGFLPVFVLDLLIEHWPDTETLDFLSVACGIAVILGHNYSPWLGFKGGKGIATSAGALLAIIPWACAVVMAIWLGALALSRIVSLSSIAASLALPFAVLVFYPGSYVLAVFGLVAGALGVYRHRSNIDRLRRGEEPKIGQKGAAAAEATENKEETRE